jgi:ectoine hydroxylase-related dioxygenase (phytanoyl-CoA dioxygenase family)
MRKNYKFNNFHSKGYHIFRDCLPYLNVKKIEKIFFSIYSKVLGTEVNKKNYSKIILNFEKLKKFDELYLALKQFSSNTELLNFSKFFRKVLVNIFKKNFKLINTGMAIGLNNSMRTSYNWHQEKPYYPNKKTIHFQFPLLSPCNKKNGTMSVLIGSNNEGYISSTKNIKKSKKSVNSLVPQDIKNFKKKYKEFFINMKKKDFVLFHENIIHRTNKNTSPNIRLACILRFQGDYGFSIKKS